MVLAASASRRVVAQTLGAQSAARGPVLGHPLESLRVTLALVAAPPMLRAGLDHPCVRLNRPA